jgi:hypothetical protein
MGGQDFFYRLYIPILTISGGFAVPLTREKLYSVQAGRLALGLGWDGRMPPVKRSTKQADAIRRFQFNHSIVGGSFVLSKSAPILRLVRYI